MTETWLIDKTLIGTLVKLVTWLLRRTRLCKGCLVFQESVFHPRGKITLTSMTCKILSGWLFHLRLVEFAAPTQGTNPSEFWPIINAFDTAADNPGFKVVAGDFKVPRIRWPFSCPKAFLIFSSIQLSGWTQHVALLTKSCSIPDLTFTTGLRQIRTSTENKLLGYDGFQTAYKFLDSSSVTSSSAFLKPYHKASNCPIPSIICSQNLESFSYQWVPNWPPTNVIKP